MGAKSKLVVLDFETGGLDPEENPVMELAIVVSDQKDFREITTYETLIQPYVGIGNKELKYEKAALNTHGITIAECAERGIAISAVVRDCIALFKSLKPKGDKGYNKPIICGHNIAFDIAFLKYIFNLCGEKLSDFVLSNNGEIISWCTMQKAVQIWNIDPDKSISYSLGECFARAGLGSFLAHRALPDTRSTLELLKYLIDVSRGDGKATVSTTPSEKRRVIKEVPSDRVKYQM